MKTFDLEGFNEKIIALMEEHGANWTRTWVEYAGGLAQNVERGRLYQGMNAYILQFTMLDNAYTHNVWGTFATWKRLGYSVKAGEHGATVYFSQFFNDKKEEGKKQRGPIRTSFVVFNAAQVWTSDKHEEWVDPRPVPSVKTGTESVDALIAEIGIPIEYGGNQPAHRTGRHDIIMPFCDQFKSVAEFDSTRLHEMGHWVLKETNSNYPQYNTHIEERAKEELCVQLLSAIMCNILGVAEEPTKDHITYLNNWKEAIRGDKDYFKSVSVRAWNAVKWMCFKGGVEVDFGQSKEENSNE